MIVPSRMGLGVVELYFQKNRIGYSEPYIAKNEAHALRSLKHMPTVPVVGVGKERQVYIDWSMGLPE